MSRPMTKSNEAFRHPDVPGMMHRVTVDVWIAGDPGEIRILQHVAHSVSTLARHGIMPTNTESITREVLDTAPDGVVQ